MEKPSLYWGSAGASKSNCYKKSYGRVVVQSTYNTGAEVWRCLCEMGSANGPFTRDVKLRVAHAPGMPRTFSPPPTSKETAS